MNSSSRKRVGRPHPLEISSFSSLTGLFRTFSGACQSCLQHSCKKALGFIPFGTTSLASTAPQGIKTSLAARRHPPHPLAALSLRRPRGLAPVWPSQRGESSRGPSKRSPNHLEGAAVRISTDEILWSSTHLALAHLDFGNSLKTTVVHSITWIWDGAFGGDDCWTTGSDLGRGGVDEDVGRH